MTHRSRRDRGRSRQLAAWALVALSASLLSACGDDRRGGTPELTWYINNAAQEPLADECNEQADGAYTVTVSLLPNAAAGQREQILRRLAAGDESVDIVSVDPPYMPELANAGFLRAFTDEEREEFSEGVLRGPLEQASYEDTMFSAPFYGNTQLLWYKKSVAEQAGLDLTQPVTWDQVIEAAEQTGTTVGVQGRRDESLMVWVNALVESAGGTILDGDSQGAEAEDVEATIASDAGAEAARIMSTIANSEVAPPALSTAGEEQSRIAFQAESGGFMVNWPYVWAAFDAAVDDDAVPPDFKDDVAWTRYPQVVAGEKSATPLGGIGLSIGAYTRYPDAAVEAIRCLRSPESQKAYMLTAGDPGASDEIYDDPEIQEKFPMYEDIREGLTDAAPRPISAYYGDVTGAIQESFHPPASLSPERTPKATADLIEGVLSNDQLL